MHHRCGLLGHTNVVSLLWSSLWVRVGFIFFLVCLICGWVDLCFFCFGLVY